MIVNTSRFFKFVGTLSGKMITITWLASIFLLIIFDESTSSFGVLVQYLAASMLVFIYLIWPLALSIGMRSADWEFQFELENMAAVFAIFVIIARLVFEAIGSISTDVYFESAFLDGMVFLLVFAGWSHLSNLFIGKQDNTYYRLWAAYKLLWVVTLLPFAAFVLRNRQNVYRAAKGWTTAF